MTRPFPPDVIVLDTDGVLHVRVQRGRNAMEITNVKSYRLAEGTFGSSVVTPELANESALSDVLRRLRVEAGKLERVSLLLPDAWFRINLIDLPSLPDRQEAALDVVRWSLKRTLPIAPETLRVAYEILGKSGDGVKLLVISALEKTLAAIEQLFAAAGMEVVLIEPVGLNIWNAITLREPSTTNDRLFVYVRDTDFTTAVFRGSQPLFIRSRNLNAERTISQEIRLSATYLRDALQAVSVERCYLAGNVSGADVQNVLAAEFSAPVIPVALRDFTGSVPAHVSGLDAELTACTGVFAG
jgi:Tfp pilus assembly PilM family ATPase